MNRETGTIQIQDLLSPLGGRGIEKRLTKIPGVDCATVNDASGSVMLTFDADRVDLASLTRAVQKCGYDCSGDATPEALSDGSAGTTCAAQAVPAKLDIVAENGTASGPKRHPAKPVEGPLVPSERADASRRADTSAAATVSDNPARTPPPGPIAPATEPQAATAIAPASAPSCKQTKHATNGSASKTAQTAQDIGHGGGMDMAAMVRNCVTVSGSVSLLR